MFLTTCSARNDTLSLLTVQLYEFLFLLLEIRVLPYIGSYFKFCRVLGCPTFFHLLINIRNNSSLLRRGSLGFFKGGWKTSEANANNSQSLSTNDLSCSWSIFVFNCFCFFRTTDPIASVSNLIEQHMLAKKSYNIIGEALLVYLRGKNNF